MYIVTAVLKLEKSVAQGCQKNRGMDSYRRNWVTSVEVWKYNRPVWRVHNYIYILFFSGVA